VGERFFEILLETKSGLGFGGCIEGPVTRRTKTKMKNTSLSSVSSSAFAGYIAPVSNDPAFYGGECTQEDADRISDDLSKMIIAEFPGITVTYSEGKVTGPDSETVEEIRVWIEENWMNAL
jgi:phosphoglucomutase